ncbi:MAG: hypothetical protein IKH44_13175 [Bacteroidales bacterium]|nr:hypothetical protein [Bacteroidales bacterium]MBR3730187.1 hypothetical protein [Bacteroidales bacterium]MBR6227785.1 hypothetical protein [Bacteroidales bacterium]
MKKALLTLAVVMLAVAAQAQIKVHDNGHVSLGCLNQAYGVQVQPNGYVYFRTQGNTDYGWATLSMANVTHQQHWIVKNEYDSSCQYDHMFYVFGNGAAYSTHHYTITGCNVDNSRGTAIPIDGEQAVSIIKNLNGFYYESNSFISQEELENNEFVRPEALEGILGDRNKHSVSLSAENLSEVFPDAVRTDPEARLCIDYDAVITMLAEAVKQQQSEIELLRKTLEENGLMEPEKR